MKTHSLWCVLPAMIFLTAVTASAQEADEQRFSGPQPGESAPTFEIMEVTDPFESKRVEVVSDESPTLLVFMHNVSEPAIGLIMTLEWFAAKHSDLDDHYVVLPEDTNETETMLRRWSQRPFLSESTWSYSVDGLEGPGAYGLNRNMDMTILLVNDQQVVDNFALLGPNNTDAQPVLEAMANLLEVETPEFETIRDEIRAERDRRREEGLRNNPVFRLAPVESLGRLMVAMLNMEGASEERVNAVAKEMKDWAEGNDERQAALREYCQSVLDGSFEVNRYAREALEEMSK